MRRFVLIAIVFLLLTGQRDGPAGMVGVFACMQWVLEAIEEPPPLPPAIQIAPAPVDKSASRPSQIGTIFLKFEEMKVRSVPGFSGSIVDTVGSSTPLKAILEKDLWIFVETPSGHRGWVARAWLKD